jgi:hypothetical protein
MTIITSNFTTVSRPRRRSPKKTVKQTFRGVVSPSLGVLIRDQGEQENNRRFSPVDKEFYKPDNSIEFRNLSLARQEQSNNSFTFAPTIELSCFLQPFINRIRASYHRQKLQTITADAKERFATPRGDSTSINYEVTNILRRETKLDLQTNSLINLIQQAASNPRPNPGSTTALTQQHLHIHLPGVAKTGRRFGSLSGLTTLQSNFALHRHRTSPVSNLFWSTAIANVNMEPVRYYRSSDNSFLTQRKLTSSNSVNNPAFFTTVSLNFAAPKLSDTEKINQRIAHFISTPALTYVKAQQSANETLIQTLRELRSQPPQQRPPAVMQMPSIEQLTNQVKTQIEREILIERERRGL